MGPYDTPSEVLANTGLQNLFTRPSRNSFTILINSGDFAGNPYDVA